MSEKNSNIVEVKKFLSLRQEMPIIDVRSPSEYFEGHIIGAKNVFLFNDEERAEVGTIYKQVSKEKAIERGLEFIGPRMASYVRKAKKIAPNKIIGVYCARGGMRSGSIAWLLETAGFTVYRLEGGYKSYRRYMDFTANNTMCKLLLIGGATGSGKTDILKSLSKKGEQVIDLEGLASHKGSAFGALGLQKQPSTETFMNNLYEQLITLNPQKPIWVENESKLIGHIFIPDTFWRLMKNAPILSVEVPLKERIDRILREYGCFSKDELKQAMNKIAKRLGGDNHNKAIEAIEKGNIKKAIEISLIYYDKAYRMSTEKYKDGNSYTISVDKDSPNDTAEAIIKWYNDNFENKE